MTEALSWTHAHVERDIETPPKVSKLRCSFCQAELHNKLELTIAGAGAGAGQGRVNRLFLLGALPELRSRIGCASSFAARA